MPKAYLVMNTSEYIEYIEKIKGLRLDKNDFLEMINGQNDNNNIYVGTCELGYCVRANRYIKKGEYIYTFNGITIDFAETTTRGEWECMPLQYGDDKYIDTEAPGMFVNHSCEPNAGIKGNFDLIAIVDIPIHEEIRFDYSTTMDEDHYQMECKCGKPSCRNIVTDFKKLPIEVREKYLQFHVVMPFISKKYEKESILKILV